MSVFAEEMQQEPAFMIWVLYQVAGELIENLEVKAVWECISSFYL